MPKFITSKFDNNAILDLNSIVAIDIADNKTTPEIAFLLTNELRLNWSYENKEDRDNEFNRFRFKFAECV